MATLGTIRFLRLLGRGFRTVGRILIVIPVCFIGRVLLRVSLPVYRLMFNAKHRALPSVTKERNHPTLLSILTGKYLIHIAIAVLTIGATVSNVSARGTGMGDLASGSVLSAFSTDENTEDIIERAPARTVSYVDHAGCISPEVTFEAELGSETDVETAIADTGDALQVTPNSSDDITQRSDVTTYIVQGGDTLGGIANRFGITQSTILSANNLSNADFIKPGQELLIPPITGVLHKVVKGDTIASIASKYKADAQEILDYNHLADASAITIGQSIMVPGGVLPQPVTENNTSSGTRTGGGSSSSTVVPPASAPVSGGKLNWPTYRLGINQYFKYGHTGIDAECKLGNPLYAAAAGTVQAVVYQSYGYGYYVVINHGSGFTTLYAHASKIFVKPGQRVTRGQTIALCGTTGRSTGSHVHFETRVNGVPVNPLKYF